MYFRQMAQQKCVSIPLDELPSRACEETLEEHDDVMVRHGARTLAVSRVKRDGFYRLKRWPTALDRRP